MLVEVEDLEPHTSVGRRPFVMADVSELASDERCISLDQDRFLE